MSLVEKYNKAPTKESKLAVKEQIETLKNTFNKNSGGYLNDVDINYGTKTVKIKDKTPEIYKTSKEDTYAQILKNVKHSNTYFKNKGINDRILQGDEFNKFQRDLKNRINTNQSYKSLAIGVPTAAVATQFLSGEANAAENVVPETGFTTGEKAAGTAAAGTIGTKTGRKALGKFAAGAFGPLGLVGLNAGLGVDPTQSIDRLGLGLEATFLKDAVKGTIGATKGMKNRALQKGIQRILNAGMSVPTALKVARYASPLGIASLAGEGLYQVGKLGYEDQQRFNALSPEEQAAERAEQEKFAFDIEGS